ncbi:hypothetical protein Tco_0145829 [Tanacetum coccineum]
MADNRTMAQMLQAPIEGYEDAIVVPPINANNFELKQPLINLVQSNKFTGRQDPHNHLRFFNKAPTSQIQGVSKTDFENYVKANDAVLKNVQNQGQNLQNQMANVTSLLTSLCDNFKNPASTSNTGTLPSQTVTNPRQQINAITTRSGKTLEEPSIPLVPTPDVSISQNESNLETSTEKVQNPNLENTAHVPSPGEEDSIFMEIPNPKAKKTVNVEDLNSPRPNSYPSKLPYPERMKERCTVEMSKSTNRVKLVAEENKENLEEILITLVNAEGRPFLRTAKALIDLYEEKLTLRVGKEELVYYADKSEKNKEKNFVHAISIIDFSKDDPFSGSTTNTLPPSSSPMKTSDNFEKFTDELAPLDSLPPGNDDSTLKKDFHEVNFQVYSNPLFEFDDNFKSSNVNPLFEENDKDVEIKSSSSFTLTSPKESEFEAYLKRDSIPPGIDLTLPPTLEISSSNPTSLTLTGEKIICLLATYLHKKPKPLSRPQEIEEIKEKEEVSSKIPIDTIVMPIRITFDNPIDFNDHFFKPKDFKKDLTVSFDSSESSILPSPLFESDSPFTAELSASVTLNSLRNEDKVFKPGILVYHAIHDKNLVTLEENLKENISSGILLVFKEPSFLLPPPEPPDNCLNFEPILVMKNVVDFYHSNIEDVDSLTLIIWTFLPHFTYTEESPLIFSFRSEHFVFDPDIVTFHNPVAFSMEVSCSKYCSP